MSDIVVAIRLALRILESGFTESASDFRYANFQNEIFNLHYLLQRLNEALQNAQRRYLSRQLPTGTQIYEPLSPELEDERRTLVGDFVATLRSSDALLVEIRNLKQRYVEQPNTLRMYLSGHESRIDYLRLQLRLHARKIGFVLLCLSNEFLMAPTASSSLGFLGELYNQQGLWPTQSHFGSLYRDVGAFRISPRMAGIFSRSLSVNAPSRISVDIAFDSLLTLLEQCISGQDQTPEKYLALLKTQWMLSYITTSSDYQSANPGFYFQHIAAEIKQSLDMQIKQPGRVIPYNEDSLLTLPESCFAIWPQLEIPPPPPPKDELPKDDLDEAHPLAPRATEEKILEVPLKSTRKAGSDSLTIFKSSEDRFRLIVETMTTGNKMLTQQTIYTREDKLIPRYGLPNITNLNLEMTIFSRNEEALYSFNSTQDMYNFQTALTGYDVSHDQSGVRCQFSDEAASLDCRGRIQLWQEPIAAKSDSEGTLSAGSSTIRRHSTISGTASIFGSTVSTLATTNTVHQTEGGWEADGIKLATLTVLTELQDRKKKKRLAIISIELGVGVSIDPKECRCCRDYDSCSKLVLTKGKKSKFTAKVLYTDLDASGQPNTNTFDLLPFRAPRHPAFDCLFTKQTEYLVLKFPNLAEKRTFDEELRLRFRVRDAQLQNQANFARNIRRIEAQRPQKQEPMAPLRSLSLTPAIASLPPKIEVLDPGPTLVDAMKDVKIAELSETVESTYTEPFVVEVDGMKPFVELETTPKIHISEMVKHHRRNDTFAELPGAIPWFPS